METSSAQQTPSNYSQPGSSKKAKILVIGLMVLLLAAVGYSVFAWKQNSDLQANLTAEQAKSQQLALLNSQQSQKDSTEVTAPASKTVTETLPNGQKVTFPDTAANRNVLWWNSDPTDLKSKILFVSDKLYQQYIASLDSSVWVPTCGTYEHLKADPSDMSYGLVDTSTKAVTQPQNQNCLSAMASSQNTNATTRAKAQKVLNEIKSDIEGYLKSATFN